MLRAMLHAIDHVVIRVRDLDAAAQDYARLLGRAPSWRGVHPGAGTANALFRLENSYVELLSPASEGPLARALSDQLASQGEGVAALALATDDAAALAARLRERGIEASEPAEGEGREATSGALRRWRNTFLPAAATRGPLVFAIEHLSPADALPLAAPTAAGRGDDPRARSRRARERGSGGCAPALRRRARPAPRARSALREPRPAHPVLPGRRRSRSRSPARSSRRPAPRPPIASAGSPTGSRTSPRRARVSRAAVSTSRRRGPASSPARSFAACARAPARFRRC